MNVIELTKKLNGDIFIFGKLGQDYADVNYLNDNQIKSIFQDYQHPEYKQKGAGFIPYLGIIDLNLNAGDCIFFSTYLVHSSPSNGSPDERISLVSQARPADFEPNQKIFNQEAAFRKDFVTNELMKICEANNKVKKYNEFYKSK